MEQTKNPGDVVASLPDKGNPCADLITIRVTESTYNALCVLSEKVNHIQSPLSSIAMCYGNSGLYFQLVFESSADVSILATVDNATMMTLLRGLCEFARGATQ